MIWKNLKWLFRNNIESHFSTVINCTARYVPYEKAVAKLHEAQAESYRQDIFQKDPIELFKADRVPILTSKAITLMRWLADDYEDFLVVHLLDRSPQELLAIDGVGEKTVGYVQSVLGRHGLTLAGGEC